MNWKQKVAEQAKKAIDARGGSESLKQDAEELRNIAKGEGSAKDKLRAAAQAIKEPGARSEQPEAHFEEPEAQSEQPE
jgi:hypothetical protein